MASKIEKVLKNEFLGVIINHKLNWSDQKQTVNNKISKNIGILYKIRLNLSTQTLLMLYHALIQPYLEYCNIIWAAGYLLDRVFRKQKKSCESYSLLLIEMPTLVKY